MQKNERPSVHARSAIIPQGELVASLLFWGTASGLFPGVLLFWSAVWDPPDALSTTIVFYSITLAFSLLIGFLAGRRSGRSFVRAGFVGAGLALLANVLGLFVHDILFGLVREVQSDSIVTIVFSALPALALGMIGALLGCLSLLHPRPLR